jgi:hypothetical protein
MIHLLVTGNQTKEVNEHDNVDGYSMTIKRHSTIAASTSRTAISTLPFPAASVFVDLYFAHDSVKDLLPAVSHGGDFHQFFPWFRCLSV